MSKAFLLTIFGLFGNFGFAQKKLADSLIQILNSHTTADTVRLNLLNEISYSYSSVDPRLGVNFATEAIALATQLHDKMKLAGSYTNKGVNYNAMGDDSAAMEMYSTSLQLHEEMHNTIGVAKVLHNMGIIQSQRGNYYKALEYHKRSLGILTELNDKQRMSHSLNSIGVNCMYLTDYPKSLDHFLKALHIYDALGVTQSSARANTLTNIGIIYKDLGNFERSLEYHQKALDIFEKSGNHQGSANVLGNIGVVYNGMKDAPSALDYFARALQLNTEVGNNVRIASDLTNIAVILINSEKYSEALVNLKKAFAIYQGSGDKNSMAISLNAIGEIYRKAPAALLEQEGLASSQRYSEAIKFHKRALQLSKDDNALDRQRESLALLADTYEAKGDFLNALKTTQDLAVIKDSILNDERKQQLTRMEMQFDFEKKEAQLRMEHDEKQAMAVATISRQRIVKNALIAGSIILIAGALSTFFLYKRKRDAESEKKAALFKAEVAETEMKALRSQMNPHFIFNSLNSISNYISKNNLVAADDYLTKFARVMRLILENSEQKEVTLADELKALELYTQLEALRLENKFSYHVDIDKSIDPENTMIPPLILQPFVENSIWHGIANKSGMGKIMISLKRSEGLLVCTIEDDGIGRSRSKSTSTETNKSLGMKITKARFNIINKTKNSDAAINVTDLPEGLRVDLRLPFEERF